MRKSGGRVAQEFAVVGLGRFGTSLAKTLVENGHTVLGIDRDMDLVQRYSHLVTQTIQLDSTDEKALAEIDVASYHTVVVAIGQNFEANLMTTVALKSLGVREVICKATTEQQKFILERVGADSVVLPEYEAGARLADTLTRPSVVSQMMLSPGIRVSEVKVPDSKVGLNLEELSETGLGFTVVAVQRGESVLTLPKKGTVLRSGDLLVVIGPNDAVQKFGAS